MYIIRVLLNPGVPGHFQNHRPMEQGQPIVPSQHQVHFFAQQKPYPNLAMQKLGTLNIRIPRRFPLGHPLHPLRLPWTR